MASQSAEHRDKRARVSSAPDADTSQVSPVWPLFAWARAALAHLAEYSTLSTRSLLCRGHRVSTCCSGLGTAEAAIQQILAASPVVASPVSLQHVASVEADNACCSALVRRGNSEAHVFKNLFDFFPGSKPGKVGKPKEKFRSFCKSYAASHEVSSDPEFTCLAHDKNCSFPPVDGCIAGTPCQPWSRMGKRLGGVLCTRPHFI